MNESDSLVFIKNKTMKHVDFNSPHLFPNGHLHVLNYKVLFHIMSVYTFPYSDSIN